MTPTYFNGDYVLAIKWPRMSIGAGDTIVVSHRHFGTIVKRVSKIVNHEEFLLVGDNLIDSVSSQDMGRVSRANLIGKVFKAFKQ